jgi:hypothetical protein
MLNTALYVLPQSGIVGQVLKDEAVLLLPAQGEVKVLNEVGARIWSLTDGTCTIKEIAAVLTAEYAVEQVQAEADTVAFVADLLRRNIVVLSPQPVPAPER